MDLTLLGVAAQNRWRRKRVAVALGIVLAITLLDAFSAEKSQRNGGMPRHAQAAA